MAKYCKSLGKILVLFLVLKPISGNHKGELFFQKVGRTQIKKVFFVCVFLQVLEVGETNDTYLVINIAYSKENAPKFVFTNFLSINILV